MDSLKNILKEDLSSTQLKEWGFTIIEIEQLGLVCAEKYSELIGKQFYEFGIKEILGFYRDIITNPDKYITLAKWLEPRLNKFIELNVPLRIYVGGEKQFLARGDEVLEKSLLNISKAVTKFINTKKIKLKNISVLLYYLNLIH